MYTSFQLAKKYLHYYFTASNSKGHGVHSPFVFDFIKFVKNDNKQYEVYDKIEVRRNALLDDNTIIEVEDFGAGSAVIKANKRIVKNMAQSSLKPKKFAQLLFRMVQYYQPKTIVELGTSFGITTAYLAAGNNKATVNTCEGAASIAEIAQQTFLQLKSNNVKLTQGDFANTLPSLLNQLQQIDFAFIDGNHRKAPTLNYFQQLLVAANPSTILVFDDIHWSEEMEAAWVEIQQHPAVTLTIDLFFIGIVCINDTIKAKQHFIIKF